MSDFNFPRCPKHDTFLEDGKCIICDDRMLGVLLHPVTILALIVLVILCLAGCWLPDGLTLGAGRTYGSGRSVGQDTLRPSVGNSTSVYVELHWEFPEYEISEVSEEGY